MTINDYKYTREELAAVTYTKRIKRFYEHFDEYSELNDVIRKFFNDKLELEQTGLTVKYRELQKFVEEKYKIGFILLGLDEKNIPQEFKGEILNYTTVNGNNISLTIHSICKCLVDDFINKTVRLNGCKNGVEVLCRNLPNFNVYYSALSE